MNTDIIDRLEEAILDASIADQLTDVTHSVVISRDDALRILATLREARTTSAREG